MLPPALAAALAPGTVIGDKYRVERLLGSGGMGAVVAARHLELGQDVAIKVLLPSAAKSPESTARFLREGRSAAQLTSPHVAKVFDTGRLASGAPYLVMELLRGRDLRAHLAEVRRVPLAQAVDWILQAAHAVAEAHARSIIHRDLKPANLFLAETSAGQQIKVLDFGVSKQLGSDELDLTKTTSAVGTPRYMAPEQMRSARLADARGDVWSLGIVLYELTTGEAPFRGDSVPALCFDVMERTPVRPSQHDPELPSSFDEVIARCLEKEPGDRFQSVEALAAALRAVVPGSRSSGLFHAAPEPSPVSGRAPVSSVLSGQPDARGSLVPRTETFPAAQPLFPSAPPHETMPGWNTTPVPRPAIKKASRAPLIGLGVAIGVGAATLVGVVAGARDSAAPHEGAGARTSSASIASDPDLPSANALPAPSALGPDDPPPRTVSAEPIPVDTAVASASASVAPSGKAGAPVPSNACRPPYYVDEKGYQRVKPWCR